MRKILLAALALGLMTSAAAAEPQNEPRTMTEAELEQATAGADLVSVGVPMNIGVVVPTNVAANTAFGLALGVLAKDIEASVPATVGILGQTSLVQGSSGFGMNGD